MEPTARPKGASEALHGAQGGNDIDGVGRGKSVKQSEADTKSDVKGRARRKSDVRGGDRRSNDIQGIVRRLSDDRHLHAVE